MWQGILVISQTFFVFFSFNAFTLPILPVTVNTPSSILLCNSETHPQTFPFSLTTLLSDGGGEKIRHVLSEISLAMVSPDSDSIFAFHCQGFFLLKQNQKKIQPHCPSQIDLYGDRRWCWWWWIEGRVVSLRQWGDMVWYHC